MRETGENRIPTMERTRKSLYYAAGYLYFGGAGFLLAPSVMLDIFFAEGIYSSVTLRMIGAVMLSAGIVVSKVIERSMEALYVQYLYARIPVLLCLAYIYWDSLDRMWLIILVVVLVGWLYSLCAFLLDRRDANKKAAVQP
jgi:hypothetical protein